MAVLNALADTSLFIAMEQGRRLRSEPPSAVAVSVVTIGELRFGVLAATDPAVKAQRLRTLTWALSFDPLPVDDAVSTAWAELREATRHRRPVLGGSDSWIAATAIAHGLPLATRTPTTRTCQVSPSSNFDVGSTATKCKPLMTAVPTA